MKKGKWIRYLFLGIFFTSCDTKTPETIVGIKLGSIANDPVKQARSSGLLFENSNGSYVNLPNEIKGYTEFYTSIQKSFLNEVIVRFCSNKNPYNVPLLNVAEKSTIVELYENKYGVCRPYKDGDQSVLEPNQIKSGPISEPNNYYNYYWKKGHLVLTLTFVSFEQYGEDFFSALATYKFDDEFEEELKEANKPKVGI